MDWLDVKEFLKDTFKYIIFIIAVLVIAIYVVGLQQVVGPSMSNTLNNGDIVILDKLSYRFTDIKRGDIVALYYADTKYLIKRVIGLPGDTIEFQDNKLYINNAYYDESYFCNKEILSFLLANTSCPFDLVYSYYFVSKTVFNKKLIAELKFRNPNLIEVLGFFGRCPHVYDLNYGIEKIIKSTLSNMPIDYLYYKCSNDIFYFDNYYIQSYLADVNMNPNINISNIELLLIENQKKDLSGKFLCNQYLLSELYHREPTNFYRIRPYVHDHFLSDFRVKEMDLQFSNIVSALQQGYFIPDILNYTWCYNCHAADYNKFLFLKALIKSDGIRNGFLCNECLEVANNLKEKLEFNLTIMLVEESVKQFFKWNINNIGAPYDHYTHMILAKAKALLEELQNYNQCYNMVCQYLNKLNTEINYVSQFAPDFFSNIYALNNSVDVLILSMYDPNISMLTKYFKELSIQRFNGQVPRLPVASQKCLKSIHKV